MKLSKERLDALEMWADNPQIVRATGGMDARVVAIGAEELRELVTVYRSLVEGAEKLQETIDRITGKAAR